MGITYSGKFFYVIESSWSKGKLNSINGRSYYNSLFTGFYEDFADAEAIEHFWYLDIEETT